jgi:hypothetical protein
MAISYEHLILVLNVNFSKIFLAGLFKATINLVILLKAGRPFAILYNEMNMAFHAFVFPSLFANDFKGKKNKYMDEVLRITIIYCHQYFTMNHCHNRDRLPPSLRTYPMDH